MPETTEAARPSRLLEQVLLPAYVLAFSLTLGLLAGLGFYTFNLGEGWSYFSRDPKACVNCHIMQAEYDSWNRSSHHGNAVCVECHLPVTFFRKYLAKADNGWRHSRAFTLQNFPDPIQITAGNAAILQENCERCHEALVSTMVRSGPHGESTARCVHCHRSVGHGP